MRGSVGKALDWGLKDCLFKTHSWRSHCFVSFSKTLKQLVNTGSTQEDTKSS